VKKPTKWTSNSVQKLALAGVLVSTLMAFSTDAAASVTSPVIGSLLWSEEFNGTVLDSKVWTAENGNGCQINLCGYGNAELEYYSPNNVSIVNVPFEPATRALAIKAQREVIGSNAFTSGKVSSAGKVQVKYGMVEMRVSTPAVGTGLWPAAWMLGSSPQTWPRNGEIDILEMGQQAAIRATAAPPTPSANNFVGSNVITFQSTACVPGNASCAASTAWQTPNWYIASTPLVNRFVTYRLYWTDTQMRFTVVDNGVERNLYQNPLPVNSASLQAPFYLLLNLAVGGNFTDAPSAAQVTAPLPGTMYVDYIRVYQLDGKGSVTLGNQITPEVGKFGVFTDLTAVSNKLVAGTSSDIFVWNNASTSAGNTAPFEGANVMAWNYTTPNQWFGGSVESRQARNMSNFLNGNVKLKIKIPANVAFTVGIQDTYTNQNSVTFPANTTAYGMVRDGNWATATIPVSALAGTKVALQSMLDLFQIASDANHLPTAAFQMAIDDIVWDSGTTGTPPPPPTPDPTPATLTSVSQTSATTLQFTVNTSSWADVHYTVNGGGQQNIRMRQDAGANTYAAGGLKIGDAVNYTFTYWDVAKNFAVDTTSQGYTMK
jgi:beta-glucanase (GH16 family)